METLTVGFGWPASAARQAQRAERLGFDGLLFADSQSMMGDPYVALTMAAQATTRLRVGTGVTNPATRHPAVTACAVSTIHAEFGGRAILGIGRGDSALANLGKAPVPVEAFERYLEQIQLFLRGEEVPYEYSSVDSLRLARGPSGASLRWLPSDVPKVPVQVFASGPRVIAAAARHAERITFAVGAEPARLEQCVAEAREAGQNSPPSLGAMVLCAPHPDVATARELIGGSVATMARFAGMQGAPSGPVHEDDRAVYEGIRKSYDMTRHGERQAAHADVVTPEFIGRFAVLGSVEACVERLQHLAALGLEHFGLIPPGGGRIVQERESSSKARQSVARTSFELLTREVMPALKEAVAAPS
jgi:5,10-methylenetetrahydromethanopterin reductase